MVLTQFIRIDPIIEPDIDSSEYSFIVNTLPKGLSIDTDGVITGYIEDDSVKEINIKVVGDKEVIFKNVIEIKCKISSKCRPQMFINRYFSRI